MANHNQCENCSAQYREDPALRVACPKCGAKVGRECTSLAPSGHRKSRGFQGLPPWGHDERDLLAAAEGKFDLCRPDCGITPAEAARRLQAMTNAKGRTNPNKSSAARAS